MTKKQLDELNARQEQDNKAKDIIQSLRQTKGLLIDAQYTNAENSRNIEFNKLKEAFIKEISQDYKDIEWKFREMRSYQDETSRDLSGAVEKLKITKSNLQITLKDIQGIRDQIDDMKRRLQELAIMAAKYGSTDKVDEELQYYREKLIEMDDRIAKLKIEIDVTNQINDNKRNEIRNRDEYIKRLRLMIEMRKNIPEPVVVAPPPPPKQEQEYVAVVGDDVDELMA